MYEPLPERASQRRASVFVGPGPTSLSRITRVNPEKLYLKTEFFALRVLGSVYAVRGYGEALGRLASFGFRDVGIDCGSGVLVDCAVRAVSHFRLCHAANIKRGGVARVYRKCAVQIRDGEADLPIATYLRARCTRIVRWLAAPGVTSIAVQAPMERCAD